MSDIAIIHGDARQIPLRDGCVQCVVTSPPYWGLRKYAGAQDLVWGGKTECIHRWNDSTRKMTGGTNGTKQESVRGCEWNSLCNAWRGGYGLEPTIEMYVAHTVEILREIRRVLRSDGVVFWNIGDSYHNGDKGGYRKGRLGLRSTIQRSNMAGDIPGAPNRNPQPGLKPKDLCLIPARVAIAAQADGWWVRSLIIWAKPNPMPESCTDRPTDAYEHIIMLTKSERYFWDADAVREPSISGDTRKPYAPGQVDARGNGHDRGGGSQTDRDATSRNLRNVWTFPTQPYKGAHFATFPEEIPRRCILAATSERGACLHCGAPWERIVKASGGTIGGSQHDHEADDIRGNRLTPSLQDASHGRKGHPEYKRETIGWEPSCKCLPAETGDAPAQPCLVLDPFGGSGTTARVAIELNRRAVSLDLAYHDHAERRTTGVQRQLIQA